jgi:DNA-binding MarR family transcriptional regulator
MGIQSSTKTTRLDGSALHLLHRVVQSASDLFAEEMGPGGLTPRQFAVLLTVSQHEGESQTNLVRLTGIDRSTLADIIRRMLKKGLLVRRRTKKDARAYAVRPTEAGLDALRAAAPAAKLADQRILGAFDESQRREFIAMLNLIVNSTGRPPNF